MPPTSLWDGECLFVYVWARNSEKRRSNESTLNYNYWYLLLLVPNTSDDMYTDLVNQTIDGKSHTLNNCYKAERFLAARTVQGTSKICWESLHIQDVPDYPLVK